MGHGLPGQRWEPEAWLLLWFFPIALWTTISGGWVGATQAQTLGRHWGDLYAAWQSWCFATAQSC